MDNNTRVYIVVKVRQMLTEKDGKMAIDTIAKDYDSCYGIQSAAVRRAEAIAEDNQERDPFERTDFWLSPKEIFPGDEEFCIMFPPSVNDNPYEKIECAIIEPFVQRQDGLTTVHFYVRILVLSVPVG